MNAETKDALAIAPCGAAGMVNRNGNLRPLRATRRRASTERPC